jgi:PadR family transcriptional regulator, regulatory protein AphA
MELSSTGKVILGMVAMGQTTGYDIKQLVDKSTRNFWAASYGQIYPELKRLEELGLVEGTAEATGDRARRTYRLTNAGAETLKAWLREPPASCEMRHEALLKVFFADALPEHERAQRLLDMAAGHREKLAELRAVEASIPEGGRGASPATALRFGIEFNEWVAAWCEQAAREAAPGKAKGK